MITIRPLPRALVPVDDAAATAISGPNYDEFQSDTEVWELLKDEPLHILRVTMAHCDAASPEEFLKERSPESLDRAMANLTELRGSDRTRELRDALWIYEIESHAGPKQIGLGCMARTGEIRTDDNPGGTIVRNEGIRPSKAEGRAELIRHTNVFTDAVNNAVEDTSGKFAGLLAGVRDSRSPDLTVKDEAGNTHRIWFETEASTVQSFVDCLAAEPLAFVADGNHRSAAAGMAGHEEFLNVIFPVNQMGILPYNRLVTTDKPWSEVRSSLEESFEVSEWSGTDDLQPSEVNHIGIFAEGSWYELRPKTGTFDPADAAQAIDADIVQRNFFRSVLGMDDPKDERLNFVGGDRPASYLRQRVEAGEYRYAVTLAPVTMEQFVEVCKQGRFMPPKSTWFDPKVRSGLAIVLLD